MGMIVFFLLGYCLLVCLTCLAPLMVPDECCWSLGKVHGSLARAGKVKGQTPKVLLPPWLFVLLGVRVLISDVTL